MPEMDGTEMTKAVRQLKSTMSTVPIIMMTAFGREDVMQNGKAAGVNAFLTKPVKQSLTCKNLD